MRRMVTIVWCFCVWCLVHRRLQNSPLLRSTEHGAEGEGAQCLLACLPCSCFDVNRHRHDRHRYALGRSCCFCASCLPLWMLLPFFLFFYCLPSLLGLSASASFLFFRDLYLSSLSIFLKCRRSFAPSPVCPSLPLTDPPPRIICPKWAMATQLKGLLLPNVKKLH